MIRSSAIIRTLPDFFKTEYIICDLNILVWARITMQFNYPGKFDIFKAL